MGEIHLRYEPIDLRARFWKELNSYLEDCSKAIEEFFKEKIFIIGYVGLCIAGIMIIGMIFSMVLCCGIRSSREVI